MPIVKYYTAQVCLAQGIAVLTLPEQSGHESQLLSQSHCPILTLQNPCELQSTSPVHMNAMKINQLSTQKQFK